MRQIHAIRISEIVARNKRAGGQFFTRSTLRFFGDAAGNWSAHWINGHVYIRNIRHKRGPGMFSGCTLRGQCREVMPDGSVGMPIAEFHGLRPLQIAKAIEARRAAAESTNTGDCNND